MNFFLVIVLAIAAAPNPIPRSDNARDVFYKCKLCAARIDSTIDLLNFQFVQKVEMKSRDGSKDNLVFRISVKHGIFERRLISSTVPNGDRFNGGYDAFDKMFLLSEYFSDSGKILSSCEFENPEENGRYSIRFAYSSSSDKGDPLSIVHATLDSADYIPIQIEESIKGLPLGVEFQNDVSVGYDSTLRISYPRNVVMHVYAHFLFLKGEIAVVKIENGDLKRL